MNVNFKFINWKDYQTRKDYVKPWWFACSNDFFTNKNFLDFSPEERLTFIYLLCLASQQNSNGEFEVSERLYSALTGLKPKSLELTLSKLQKKQVIASIRSESVQNPLKSVVTEQNRTDTTEQNRTQQGNDAPDESDAIASHPESYSPIHQILVERKIKPELSQSWLKTFPDPQWVINEVNKAVSWEIANPQRRKIHFGKFVTNWMNRGWDSRKISGSDPGQTKAQQMSNQNSAMMEKLRSELNEKNSV